MKSTTWTTLMLAPYAQAQTTVTSCLEYESTVTFTVYSPRISVTWDGIDNGRPTSSRSSVSTSGSGSSSSPSNSLAGSPTGITATSSFIESLDGTLNGRISSTAITSRSSSFTSITSLANNVPGNGTSVIIPDDTMTPATNVPTSSSSTATSVSSVSSTTGEITSETSSSIEPSSSTSTTELSSTTRTESSSTTSSTAATSSATSSTNLSSTASDSPTTPAPTITTTESTTSATTASTTTSEDADVSTNQAYIDTIIRLHNEHRRNHTVGRLTWSDSLAATAKKTGDTCFYAHDTATDCSSATENPPQNCYGQNIGAGYLPNQMGYLISDGFYNGEVNFYTYYGGEPELSKVKNWGHFSQIVWRDTLEVGCYTSDCTAEMWKNIPEDSGIRAYFTVCNYYPPGNYIDEFANNVLEPIGLPTIINGFGCPGEDGEAAVNCEDGAQ